MIIFFFFFPFMTGIISSAELEATEIYEQVVENVNLCPDKFELLLGVIDEYEWLKDLAGLIRETHELVVQEVTNDVHTSYSQQ